MERNREKEQDGERGRRGNMERWMAAVRKGEM